jgi:hypothetical protein
MLDTVIITIEESRFFVTDYSKFGTTKNRIRSAGAFRKFINNPTTQDKKQGIYKPRLTLIKRGLSVELRIEFSVPKIIFGNNVDEVSDEDFPSVISTLKERLNEMGVWTTEKFIKEAKISGFDTSKNIPLTNGYTSSFAIKELSKVNLNRKLDFNDTKFRNDGSSIQYYSNSHSFVIYDKINDLRQPQKRAIDKDQTNQQMSLFNKIKDAHEHTEILRLEVRLRNKRKINSVMKNLNYSNNPLFKDIFNKTLCQNIIKHYWQEMVADKNIFLFSLLSGPLKTMQKNIKNNRKKGPRKIIYLTGLELLAKDKGVRELRQNIELIAKTSTWYGINKDIEEINNYSKELEPHGFIKDIERSINLFEAFRLKKIKKYPLAL